MGVNGVNLGELFVTIGGRTGALKQSQREVIGLLNSIDSRMQRTQAVSASLSNAIHGIGLAFGGISIAMVARDVLNTSMAFEQINLSLKAVTGSSDLAAKEMQFVSETSERLGLSVRATAQSYTQLIASAKGTTLEGQATREIFSAVAEASAKMGLSMDQTDGALRAIAQMMSKGNVQAEELRGQLGERLPGAFQIAARAMGKTTAELNKMLVDGEVIAADMLPRFADELRKTFGTNTNTRIESTRASINRFWSALDQLKLSFAETGAIDDFSSAVGWLAKNMGLVEVASIRAKMGIKGIAFAASESVGFIAAMSSQLNNFLANPFKNDPNSASARNAKDAVERQGELIKKNAKSLYDDLAKLEDARKRLEQANTPRQKSGGAVAGVKRSPPGASDEDTKAVKKATDAYAKYITQLQLENKISQMTLSGKEKEIPLLRAIASLRESMGRELLPAELAKLTELSSQEQYYEAAIKKSNETKQKAIALAEENRQKLEEQIKAGARYTQELQQEEAILRLKLAGDEKGARIKEIENGILETQGKLGARALKMKVDEQLVNDDLIQQLQKKEDLEQRGISIVESLKTKEEEHAEVILAMDAAYLKGTITGEKYNETLKRIAEREAMANEGARAMSAALVDGMEGFILSGDKASESMANLLKAINQVILRAALLNPMEKGLTGFFGSLFTPKLPAVQGNLLAPAVQGNLLAAAGASAGVYRPMGAGMMPYGAGGSRVAVNVINNAGAQVDTQEQTGANGEQIIELVLSRVSKEMNPGGRLGRQQQSQYGLSPRTVSR